MFEHVLFIESSAEQIIVHLNEQCFVFFITCPFVRCHGPTRSPSAHDLFCKAILHEPRQGKSVQQRDVCSEHELSNTERRDQTETEHRYIEQKDLGLPKQGSCNIPFTGKFDPSWRTKP